MQKEKKKIKRKENLIACKMFLCDSVVLLLYDEETNKLCESVPARMAYFLFSQFSSGNFPAR